jgi:hypothetical protein
MTIKGRGGTGEDVEGCATRVRDAFAGHVRTPREAAMPRPTSPC